MNVRQYFEQAFPSVIDEFSEVDLEPMAGMPLESVCGDACKTAIDRGKAFDDLLREGHGPFYVSHSNETLSIARIAADLCSLYICG